MTEEEIIHIKVYFISGMSTDIFVDNDVFEKMKEDFKKSWDFVIVQDSFAMRWSMVTHYEVIEN